MQKHLVTSDFRKIYEHGNRQPYAFSPKLTPRLPCGDMPASNGGNERLASLLVERHPHFLGEGPQGEGFV